MALGARHRQLLPTAVAPPGERAGARDGRLGRQVGVCAGAVSRLAC